MSARPRTVLWVVVAVGFLGTPVFAKPPDLPAKSEIKCENPVAQVQSQLSRDDDSLLLLDITCPCFWELLQSYWHSWALSLADCLSGSGTLSAGAEEQAAPPTPPDRP